MWSGSSDIRRDTGAHDVTPRFCYSSSRIPQNFLVGMAYKVRSTIAKLSAHKHKHWCNNYTERRNIAGKVRCAANSSMCYEQSKGQEDTYVKHGLLREPCHWVNDDNNHNKMSTSRASEGAVSTEVVADPTVQPDNDDSIN